MLGLRLAYGADTRGMPVTLCSTLTLLIGRFANGTFGPVIDVLGVVATILGVSVRIGFGVSQFVDGVSAVTDMGWLQTANARGAPPRPRSDFWLEALIMTLSIISAISGVGRGVKDLSKLNLVWSIVLLLTVVIFGSFLFAMAPYATGLVDDLISVVSLSFEAYAPQGYEAFVAALPAEIAGLGVGQSDVERFSA